jgi:hypothetical protein
MYFKTNAANAIELTGVTDDIAWVIKKAPEFITKAVKIVRKAEPFIDDIIDVVEDPALPEIIQRIRIIRKLKKLPVTAPIKQLGGNETDASLLRKYLPAIDAYIWVEQNKWVIPVGIATALLIPGLIGFLIGRVTKKCSVAR